jgi:crossover junction endodeoxyribonuclease RusA|tara:strand:+ start:626 stop:988 length:363 start_codon:yes stop_codon:yes gene_type:complete
MKIELGSLPDPQLNPNKRHHPMRLARTKKVARKVAWALALEAGVPRTPLSKAHITITFVAKDRIRRDLDNLVASMKAYIDGIVDAGVIEDDSATNVSYSFSYERGEKANTIVKIDALGCS